MKPINLVIDGLNSFETKQVVDFSELSKGVFGIFGKTGSGKSTILDAITLALYGKVERSKQNIDFINTKCSKALVSLSFEIFSAGKTRVYLVERVFSKRKNGKDVESSASLYELKDDDKIQIAESVSKVDAKIFEIIGLGVNEFVKCIALPQGEFSAFLKAKPSERTEIMSNIFDLSAYGERLAFSVKAKLNEYDKELTATESSLNMVSYATNEAYETAKNTLDTVKSEYEKSSKELKELSEKFAELKSSYEKQLELEEVNKKLQKLESEKPEIEALEVQVAKNETANQIKPSYEKLKKDVQDEKELTEKIANLNEIKLQKASEVQLIEQDFADFQTVFESKIIELNGKLSRLDNLKKYETEAIRLESEKNNVSEKIKAGELELNKKQEELNFILSNLTAIEEKIQKIDDFIEANKPDVDLSYALEQTKGIESELILIDDFYKQIERLIDQTESDLKIVQEEYNSAIKSEKDFISQCEKIQNSIEVAFEDIDTTNFSKLRSCDKQLEGMTEVELQVQHLDEVVDKLRNDTLSRRNIIASIESQIEEEELKFNDVEKNISALERELIALREERESIMGNNVVSMLSNHLKIGDICPACNSRVVQKVYADELDINSAQGEIDKINNQIKGIRFERDKMFASIISLKARTEFERVQIEVNNREVKTLLDGRNNLYQKYVDNNDISEESFKTLKTLIQKTADSLEELIALQNNIREAEQRVIIEKTQSGTKLSIYKNYLESLIDILYDLQKKKAEREFVIFNVNEKYENLKEYKKQIAEGKNIEIIIDSKKEEKLKLRESQNKINEERLAVEKNIAEIKANNDVLNERLCSTQKQITQARAEIVASGVPEGITLEEERSETSKALAKLKFDYEQKQNHLTSVKDNLNRTETEYNVTSSILLEKKSEIIKLKAEVDEGMLKNNFASEEELESYFIEGFKLKICQNKINDYASELKVATMQKEKIEKEITISLKEVEIDSIKNQALSLDAKVKELSEAVGKANAEFERLSKDNKAFNELSIALEKNKRNYDLAKELSQILKGKALAEYVAEEYLQEITTGANQRLSLLMDGRYTLKFENKEFFVEDNFNDAKVRPASTLSGGETFLVSLSLALSISDAITMLSSRSMDFFFLDEGFGTLDAELCEAVISALYKLESQNLSIGLISHVGELEESIKNKVLVTKDINGSKIKIIHSL